MTEPTMPQLPPAYAPAVRLGEGAFGAVYRSEHEAWGPVAVKVLGAGLRGDADASWRLGTEFRRLAAVDHPAVPRAYELGETASGDGYLAMQLMPGAPPLAPMAAEDVEALLKGAAAALAAVHAAGYVHGDVKPDNLVVAPDGSVALIDLAFAMPVGAPREGLVGTPEALAPEAWRGAPYAPEADWYALGCAAASLWTGRPAFGGETLAETARAHFEAVPVLPDGAPAPLLHRLLAKDPAARRAAIATLGGAVKPRGLRPIDLDPPAGPREAFAAFLAGEATLTALVGPAGAGKTRFLERLRPDALAAGLTWLGLRATPRPAGAARQLLRLVNGDRQGTLRTWLDGTTPPGWEVLEPRARRAALTELAAEALAAYGPALIAVDDADQLDEASRGLFEELSRRPALARLRWLLVGEQGEGIALGPWPHEQVQALVAARLGATPPAGLIGAIAGAETPGAVERALEAWLHAGALVEDETGWRFDPTRGGQGELSPAALAAPRLALAIALAAPAGGLPLSLAGLCGEPTWAARLDELLTSGWAAVRDGLIRPLDPVAAAAAIAAVPEPERRALAGTLSRAALEPGLAARLGLQGDQPHQAVPAALEAVRRLLAELATGAALQLLADAEPYLDAPARPAQTDAPAAASQRATWAALRAEANRFADKLDEALPAFDEAIALADDPGLRVSRAKCLQMRGRYDEALADVEAAEAAAGDPLLAARAALAQARIRIFRGEEAQALASSARGSALAAEVAGPAGQLVRSTALNLQGSLLAHVEPTRAAEARQLVEEGIRLAEAAGDPIGRAAGLDNLGNVLLALGDLPAARDAFAASEAHCLRANAATESLAAAMNLALTRAELGEGGAVAAAAATAREAEARGRLYVASGASLALAVAASKQAAWATAKEAFATALAHAETARNRYITVMVHLERVEAWAACWPEEAERALEALQPLLEAETGAEVRTRLALGRARLALTRHDPRAAEALAAPLMGDVNRAIAVRAMLLMGDAAMLQDEPELASERYRLALGVAEGWHARWHEEAAFWGLARAAGGARAGAWLNRLLDEPAEDGHPLARAGAAAMRLKAGRAPGPRGRSALEAVQQGLAELDEAAVRRLTALYELPEPGAAMATAATAVDPTALPGWLLALGLAEDEARLNQVLLEATLQLAGMTRGYMLSYEGGRLARAATVQIDLASELAEGFSTTIAEEALVGGEAVYVMDAAGASRFATAASVVALGLRCVLAVPFHTSREILGVVYADRAEIEPVLAAADLAILQTLAGAAAERAVALRQARAHAALLRWTEALPALCAEVAAEPTRAHALAALGRQLGARRGLWLRLADGAPLASWGDPTLLPGLAEPAGMGWLGAVTSSPQGLAAPLPDGTGARWGRLLPGEAEAVLFEGDEAGPGDELAGLGLALGALAPWLR